MFSTTDNSTPNPNPESKEQSIGTPDSGSMRPSASLESVVSDQSVDKSTSHLAGDLSAQPRDHELDNDHLANPMGEDVVQAGTETYSPVVPNMPGSSQINNPLPAPTPDLMSNAGVAPNPAESPISKKHFPILLALVVFSIIVVILLSCVVFVFLAQFLKENFVPGVSGYTEDFLLSDGEQFSLRTETFYRGALYHLLQGESNSVTLKSNIDPETVKPFLADRMSDELNKIEKVNYETSLTMSYELEKPLDYYSSSLSQAEVDPITHVLGAVNAGAVDDESISSLMKSKTGELYLTSKGSIDTSQRANTRSSTETEATFKSGDVNLSTMLETRFVDNYLYVNLDRFPRNEYFEPEPILKKWIKFTDITTLTNGVYDPVQDLYDTSNNFDFNNDEHDKLVKLLRSDVFKNTITSSYSDVVGEVATSCYIMDIRQESINRILREVSIIEGQTSGFDEHSLDLSSYFGIETVKFDLHVCFTDSSNIPIKIKEDVKLSIEDFGTLDIVLDAKITSVDQSAEIEAPTQSINHDNVDWEQMFNLSELDGFSEPTSPESYYEDYYTKDNVCEVLPDTMVCSACKNNQDSCATCLGYLNKGIDMENMTEQTFMASCMETVPAPTDFTRKIYINPAE